jgi:hypothetical protein
VLATLSDYDAHDNEHRPHQARHQRPPGAAADAAPAAIVDLDAGARIHRRKILNGLFNEYSQAA